MAVLTFDSGYFLLRAVAPPDRQHWQLLSPGLYRTQNLKAAAGFRSHSDEIAERVFNRAFNKHYDLPALPPLSFLDPHQLDGIKWALSRKRSYLAHAPGAGKTAEAIIASQLTPATGQTVFVVPPSLTANWEREIWNFTEYLKIYPTIGVVPLSAKRHEMAWRADFIVVPDSMLAKPWVYEMLSKLKIKFLAVDEASRFKEPTAERSKALYGGISGGYTYHGLFQKARHTVFLDGSPMPNRPMELWAPTYALHPEAIDCMDQQDFGFHYCGAQMNERGHWEFNHSSNEDELRTRLRKDFMHVVGEDQLNHPERRRSLLFMNQDVRSAEHKSWERKHLASLNVDSIDEDTSQGEIAHFRRELGVRKIPWVASYVGDRLETKNESILLFAWHREVCEGLAEKLSKFNPGVVIGGVKNDYREKAFDEFQRGKRKIIIGNIAAMGRGHNLQKADRVVFGEFSWTDELNKQCEKRASRRGRDAQNFVRCEYVVAPHSMDEKVLSSVFTKARRVERVIG